MADCSHIKPSYPEFKSVRSTWEVASIMSSFGKVHVDRVSD
jgi:hypothetical protein